MTYTRQQWAIDFLHGLGNANPSPAIVDWVVAWSQFETGSPPGASFNLLNTTEPNTPGVVSNFNKQGVKNYNSYQNGVAANDKVIKNGLYPDLYTALRTNNIAALQNPNSKICSQLTVWGTSHCQDIAAMSGQPGSLLLNQAFPGTGSAGTSVAPGANTTTSTASTDPCTQNIANGTPWYNVPACNPLNLGCFDPGQCVNYAQTGSISVPAMGSTGPTAAGAAAGQAAANAIPDWLNQNLSGIGIRIGLFIGALVLVIVALWMLTRNPVQDVKGGISSGLNKAAKGAMFL